MTAPTLQPLPVGSTPTLERVWLAYLACVLPIALFAPGGGHDGHRPWVFVALHVVVGALVLGIRALAVRRSAAAARVPRVLLACAGLPIVFSALCWLLPAVHPEPFEFALAHGDRWLFGDDLGVVCGAMPPLLTELLQLVYATFYVFPIAAACGAGWRSGSAAFDHALLRLAGGFLISYLGYLLVPTLGPKVVMHFPDELRGTWSFAAVRAWIDAGEANPWDCFPSGHTMLTAMSLAVTWRWYRGLFWWLLLPGVALIASTMLLRYHWVLDVLAGLALAWFATWALDALAARDGNVLPPPERRGRRRGLDVTPA